MAIAAALANTPAVPLTDEPTGELDSHTAEQIFAAFRTANEHLGTPIVIVAHDQAVAGEVRRTFAARDGTAEQSTQRSRAVTERNPAEGRPAHLDGADDRDGSDRLRARGRPVAPGVVPGAEVEAGAEVGVGVGARARRLSAR